MMLAQTGPPAALDASRQYAVAARQVPMWPLRCTRTTSSNASSVIEKIILSRVKPALLTRIESEP